MRQKNVKFDHDLVVNYYLPEKFKQIQQEKLMQFTQPLSPSAPIEGGILQTWIDHFTACHVPFAITKHSVPGLGHVQHILWKERIIQSNQDCYYHRRKNAEAV